MPPKPIKQRSVPYKVLGLLLYGALEAVIARDSVRVRVATGAFAKSCQISNSRFWEAIDWLVDLGMLRGYEKLGWGVTDFYMAAPKQINPEDFNTEEHKSKHE